MFELEIYLLWHRFKLTDDLSTKKVVSSGNVLRDSEGKMTAIVVQHLCETLLV